MRLIAQRQNRPVRKSKNRECESAKTEKPAEPRSGEPEARQRSEADQKQRNSKTGRLAIGAYTVAGESALVKDLVFARLRFLARLLPSSKVLFGFHQQAGSRAENGTGCVSVPPPIWKDQRDRTFPPSRKQRRNPGCRYTILRIFVASCPRVYGHDDPPAWIGALRMTPDSPTCGCPYRPPVFLWMKASLELGVLGR